MSDPKAKPLFSCTASDLVSTADLIYDECEREDKYDTFVVQRQRNVSYDACLVAASMIQLYAALGIQKDPDT